MAAIDVWGSTDNPVVDITQTPLGILLNAQLKGTAAPEDYPLSFAESFGVPLPPDLVMLTQGPLSGLFDQMWSQNKDQFGMTKREEAIQAITSLIQAQVPSAYNIVPSLPLTGILRSVVLTGPPQYFTQPGTAQIIFLSYEINGNAVEFNAPIPHNDIGGSILWGASQLLGGDPKIIVTFDTEVFILIDVPVAVGGFTVRADTIVSDANVSGGNLTGSIGLGLQSVLAGLSGQPPPTQATVGEIDSSGNLIPLDISSFTKVMTELSSAWVQALPFGFTSMSAFINGSARTLNLRFTHPVDSAPVVSNAAVPSYPSLFPPQLTPSFPQVQVNGTLTVTGSNFPPGQASSVYITWSDTTSGAVTESDIMWGEAGGQSQTINKPRSGFHDFGNVYAFSMLQPSTSYVFAVRDQDQLTQTPFTQPPLTITTESSDNLDLVLFNASQQLVATVGHATLDSSGGFTAPLDFTGVAAGTYTLYAVHSSTKLASTQIEVVTHLAAGLQPESRIIEGFPFQLSGSGFLAGGTVNLFIDTVGGQTLGSTPADSGGNFVNVTFTWPPSVAGAHTIWAEESVGGQTVTAHADVSVEHAAQ